MKDSEKLFLMTVYTRVNKPGAFGTSLQNRIPIEDEVWARDAINMVGDPKQNLYYLDKWTRKNWYEYGSSVNVGWLTELGKQEAQKLLPWWEQIQKEEQKHGATF